MCKELILKLCFRMQSFKLIDKLGVWLVRNIHN